MSHPRFNKWSAGCLSACAASLALSAQAQMDTFGGFPGTNALIRIPANTDDWTRHFRIGAFAPWNIKANFTMSGSSFPVSSSDPAAGIFDNGYVHKDQTGDPNLTSNWGYTSSAQVNNTANTLTLTSTSSFSTAGGSSAEDGFSPGLDMEYGGNLWYWRHARIGWDVGFDWVPVDIVDHASLQGHATESTYSYDTTGIVVPGAPYQGPVNGLGPLIPVQLPTPGAPTTTSAVISGTHELEVSLYTLRLGPSIYWDLNQRTSVEFGAGPAVGLMSGDYKYNEVVTADGVSTVNIGKVSGTDVVYGGYVSATLLYHYENHGDFFIGAQFMPMTDPSISGGGREGQLNLGGQVYLSVGINWPF